MTDLAIELEGVSKAYRFFALNDVSLTLPCGQIMGLVGPNGAGKSTLIRILMSLIHQDHGQVRLLGHSMPEEQVAAKWQVGYVSEDMRLYGYGTLGWHMRFVASIYPGWDAPYAQTLLKRFNLRTEQQIRSLSHGERAKATLPRPKPVRPSCAWGPKISATPGSPRAITPTIPPQAGYWRSSVSSPSASRIACVSPRARTRRQSTLSYLPDSR
jgi:ABC-type glutathione transport system ATPase component